MTTTATPTPRLTVRFETDPSGNPTFVQDSDKKHYYLAFEVDDLPADVYAATFELDPTYWDPVQTIFPQNRRATLRTTSYGDYGLRVTLRSKGGPDLPIIDTVVRALSRARSSMPPNPTIDSAIADLAAH
jgi:hypothetical protein